MVKNVNDVEEKKVLEYPYKGRNYKVLNTTVRWLSQCCDPQMPSYGLRFFTIGPNGYVPIHNHHYLQTMYILSGKVSVTSYNENDEAQEEKVAGPNDFVYVPSMQPHSIKNIGDELVKFLCCIAVLDEDELALANK